MQPYRIIIADDHGLFRQGVKSMIGQDSSLEVIAEAADGRELLAGLKKQTPDMVILDISMPRMNGMDALAEIHEQYPNIRVLMLTMRTNIQYFFHAISAGAHGYLLKDDSDTELLTAIRIVQQGKTYVTPQLREEVTDKMASAYRNHEESASVRLTAREKEVLQLVVNGHTSKAIAGILCLSPRTIDHHRSKLLKKFKLKSSVDLVNHVVSNSIVFAE